jgi:hypothetical protein
MQAETKNIQKYQLSTQPSAPITNQFIYGMLGLLAVGGAIYFGRKFILKRIANKEENSSLEEGTAPTYAKQLKMSFENDGWPGTDTTALRNTLRQIKSKDEFKQVTESYSKLYNSNLLKDMSNELQSTEYNEMIQIVAGKPEKKGVVSTKTQYTAWAKRMKAAFDKTYGFFPGTDSDAIIAVFNEMPTQTALVQTAGVYKSLFGTNMLQDLKNEGEFGQYEQWMKIILAKPSK